METNSNSAPREKSIALTSAISIGANVLLAALKAAVGLASSSISIILDAVNNLSDAAYLRAKEDYLMGINFSRVLTLKYSKGIIPSGDAAETPAESPSEIPAETAALPEETSAPAA